MKMPEKFEKMNEKEMFRALACAEREDKGEGMGTKSESGVERKANVINQEIISTDDAERSG